jgi:hypothetical protein
MANYSSDEVQLPTTQNRVTKNAARRQKTILLGMILLGILFLAGSGLAVRGLLIDAAVTAQIRDIFIIFLAFESLVIGIALVVLVIQIASLINLLQNEVKPILEATNETVNTLRGTTAFLSENLVEPVIKMNSYLAGLQRVLELIGLKRR